jgi:solute carrier family 25 oxoglutarate transporter 11
MTAVVPVCWTGVPFENARRAYFADKTWPLELRKGYTSPTNALLRIPFEEGPYYLFKGGFPLISHAYVFWTTYFTLYSWAKDKFFYLWVYNDFGYNFIKAGMMSIAFLMSSWLAYPLYFTREMVDIWPKERGGHCTWNNNYRQCAKWMIENMDMMYYNYLSGYWGWVRRYGAGYFIGLWMADNLGMFTNNSDAHNSLEVQFPISSESV